jgi:hypothetical protein
MRGSCLSVLAAGVLAAATPAHAETSCKPGLTLKEVRFSEVRSQQRTWTALVAVDASQCAASSGKFAINFVRLKEIGIDLPFTEWFEWSPGQVEVSLDFWEDEAVHDYSVGDIPPCSCRR